MAFGSASRRGVERVLIGKVLGRDGGWTDALVRAMLWAYKENAHVISLSVGIDWAGHQRNLSQVFPADLAASKALADYRSNLRLFDRLSQIFSGYDRGARGAIVVAAAGNQSQHNVDPRYRVTPVSPASAEEFLSVAALGQNPDVDSRHFEIAPFSNTGVRLSAPGISIWSAKAGGGLTAMSGTSMATPHVAGVAALWIEKSMHESRVFRSSEVIARIAENADPLPYLDKEDFGFGLVQAPMARIVLSRRRKKAPTRKVPPERRRRRAFVHVDEIADGPTGRVLTVFVPRWREGEPITIQENVISHDIRSHLTKGALLIATVNTEAKRKQDLVFDDFEFVPPEDLTDEAP